MLQGIRFRVIKDVRTAWVWVCGCVSVQRVGPETDTAKCNVPGGTRHSPWPRFRLRPDRQPDNALSDYCCRFQFSVVVVVFLSDKPVIFG